MNEDDNNLQPWIEPELEARVVAWVLGEASAFEVAELERLVAKNPELALFKRRIEATHQLVAAATQADRPARRLSPDRRRKLLDVLGIDVPPAARSKVSIFRLSHPAWLNSTLLGRVAACLVIAVVGVTILSSILPHGDPKSLEAARRSVRDQRDMPLWPAAKPMLAAKALDALPAQISPSKAPTGSNDVPSSPQAMASGNAYADAAASRQAKFDGFINYGRPIDAGGDKVTATAADGRALAGSGGSMDEVSDESGAFEKKEDAPLANPTANGPISPRPRGAETAMAMSMLRSESEGISGHDDPGVAADGAARVAMLEKDETPENRPAVMAGNRAMSSSGGQLFGAAMDVAPTARAAILASPAEDMERSKGVDLVGGETVTTKSGNTDDDLGLIDQLVESGTTKQAESKRAEFAAKELKANDQPFSTFSLHVADVSFRLAKDALNRGEMPDPARIRPEEFYNAFDYDDPSPATAEPISCHIEQSAHPFLQQRNLVRIAMKVAASGRTANQPLRLTILLDTSGSMEREDRAASVRRALASLASLLGPQDRVTLVGLARQPRLLAEQLPGNEAGKLVEIAGRTPSDGGTNLEAALDLAGELALKQRDPAAQNRVVLLTDGGANLGDAKPDELAKKIAALRQQGIAFDACGVGADGLNDEILEALTRKGDGRYYFLDKPSDADAGFAKQLAGAFRPAAENVKVQVKFNPARVGKYRLIGFDEYRLEKEDFRNDRVDAAKLSAEEAAVALYQVEPLPDGEGELGEVFVRFRNPATGAMVERSWTLPYDDRAPAFDHASPSMQLAGAAALLAEKLRGNDQVDLGKFAPIVNALRGSYPQQRSVQDLLRMFGQVAR